MRIYFNCWVVFLCCFVSHSKQFTNYYLTPILYLISFSSSSTIEKWFALVLTAKSHRRIRGTQKKMAFLVLCKAQIHQTQFDYAIKANFINVWLTLHENTWTTIFGNVSIYHNLPMSYFRERLSKCYLMDFNNCHRFG